MMAVSLTLASVGLIAAIGFLFDALYLYLADFVSPVNAALLTALSGLLFALIVLGLGRLAVAMRARRKDDVALLFGALLGKEFFGLADARPATRILVALAAGFAIGLSPRLRKILSGLL